MVRDFTKILLLDLELTCWADGTAPVGEFPEVIQIGTCLYDIERGERMNRMSLLVKPVHSTVSQYCTDLTGITPIALKKHGITLEHAARRLLNLGLKRYAWASFGLGDRLRLEQDMGHLENYPLNDHHYDLSTLGAMVLGSTKKIGQAAMLQAFGLASEGRQHDASWDAWNLAAAVPYILRLPMPTLEQVAQSLVECKPAAAPPG